MRILIACDGSEHAGEAAGPGSRSHAVTAASSTASRVCRRSGADRSPLAIVPSGGAEPPIAAGNVIFSRATMNPVAGSYSCATVS